MFSTFTTFFQLGLEHIADIKGYDHILYIIAMCAIYKYSEWKKTLILVTAFTIGHSLTLALAALKIVQVNAALIEFLIPLTIFITAIFNLVRKEKTTQKMEWNYPIALGFGLIHGLGFSNFFRSLMGKDADIIFPLFSFNVGLEIGQLIIVILFLFLNFIVINISKDTQRYWNWGISGVIAGFAFLMILKRFPY
jgi:hypothetical protein